MKVEDEVNYDERPDNLAIMVVASVGCELESGSPAGRQSAGSAGGGGGRGEGSKARFVSHPKRKGSYE